MINSIVVEELKKYDLQRIEDFKSALREVAQKIILSGLARSNMFDYVAFYGGTSLRLLHGLDRFSEDLDFTLIRDSDGFDFVKCLSFAEKELNSYGINAISYLKEGALEMSIIRGYIKINLLDCELALLGDNRYNIDRKELLNIKVEVETKYYADTICEYKTVFFPTIYKVRTFDMQTMFACKLCAVLNRHWLTRVKGRDYFDYLYYISLGTGINYKFLSNVLDIENMCPEKLKELLIEKFNTVDFDSVLKDVEPFMYSGSRFKDCFNKEVFLATIENIK